MERTHSLRKAITALLIIAVAACAAPPAPPPEAPAKPAPPEAPAVVPAPAPGGVLGTWKGTSPDGQPVTMSLQADGKVRLTTGTESDDGTYTVDLSSTPGKLDIRGPWLGNDRISTLIELVDAAHMRVENNAPGAPRPAGFSPDSILFTRE